MSPIGEGRVPVDDDRDGDGYDDYGYGDDDCCGYHCCGNLCSFDYGERSPAGKVNQGPVRQPTSLSLLHLTDDW